MVILVIYKMKCLTLNIVESLTVQNNFRISFLRIEVTAVEQSIRLLS